jgi:hypothetical protein
MVRKIQACVTKMRKETALGKLEIWSLTTRKLREVKHPIQGPQYISNETYA